MLGNHFDVGLITELHHVYNSLLRKITNKLYVFVILNP